MLRAVAPEAPAGIVVVAAAVARISARWGVLVAISVVSAVAAPRRLTAVPVESATPEPLANAALPVPVELVMLPLTADAVLELPVDGRGAMRSGLLVTEDVSCADAALLVGFDDDAASLVSLDVDDLPDTAASAWATPEPLANAAPTPNVIAPAPSQA
ncbi:hypothetical protein [Mycobacterium sp. RTGN5]|uniref:hypothetical protein n=1 Tax=Mycobacterium sp. RTGN5 TaxID=3016522 RepID=UPI0029C6ABAD|nr:hypothetical protein [Mycobacterium sp. RTGN5]